MNLLLFVLTQVTLATLQLDEASQFEVSQSTPSSFEGNMQVNGINYSTSCDCGIEAQREADDIRCSPSRLILSQDRAGEGADYNTISQKFTTEPLTYVRVPYSSFSCLDGRVNQPVLSTPGGDAGEFILALLVYEDVSGSMLNEDVVEQYLVQYLNSLGDQEFTMCTDDQAISHLQQQLAVEGINIQNPRENLRVDLLNALTEPENVGDSHIRMMLRYPDMYAIRPEVIQYFLRAYYRLLWSQTPHLRINQLVGIHNETAFVELRSSDSCNAEQVAPLVRPRSGGTDSLSLLVNHLDAISIRRAQLATFFAERVARFRDNIDDELILSRLNHHGLFFLDITGSYIAKSMPFYTARLVC